MDQETVAWWVLVPTYILILSYLISLGIELAAWWVRKNKKGNFDKNGQLAYTGITNQLVLNQAIDDFENISKKDINSYDINDFEINFIYLVYLLIMTIGFLISVLTGAIGLTTIKNQN